MTLKTDIEAAVKEIYRSAWSTRDGQVVPEDSSLRLGNDAVKLDATVLYADMADSTLLVDNYKPAFAAEIYKTYLLAAARVLKSEGGEITAYDGDRIMAVFIGSSKNTKAVRAAMKIHYATKFIVQPALQAQYFNDDYNIKHVVGIDTSSLFVARTGVRGANDLVWVGRAANYAAKMAAFPDNYQTYITSSVLAAMSDSVRYSQGRDMWEAYNGTLSLTTEVYRSNFWWSFE